MDWKENEVREDLGRVRAMIDALSHKYGDDFSCVWSAGCNVGEAWAGGTIIVGEYAMLHMACHGLLDAPKFIDGICDAIKCTLQHSAPKDTPEFLTLAMLKSIDSLKKVLLVSCKERMEEKDINKAVESLIQSVFGHNKES